MSFKVISGRNRASSSSSSSQARLRSRWGSSHQKDLLALIALFSAFSVLLLGAAYYASGLAARLMERNYRTVKYAAEMQGALSSMYLEASGGKEASENEIARFDKNLAAEKLNITEIGEPETVVSIERQWSDLRKYHMTPTRESYRELSRSLEELSSMNEKAMHAYEEQSRTLSKTILCGGVLGLVLVVLYAAQIFLNSERAEPKQVKE